MYTRSVAVKRPRPESLRAPARHLSSASSSKSGSEPEQNTSTTKPSQNANPKITSRKRACREEETREKHHKDRLCQMCSDSTSKSYHHHFSSADIRRMFLNSKQKEDERFYPCPMCDTQEPVVIPSSESRRVLLSDSTMFSVWRKPLPADAVHFDIECIVGGKVRDIKTALQKNYLHMPNRFEILVIAGLNNIGVGQSPEQIISDMREIRKVVKEHSDKWSHVPPSYVTFCTIPLAPKFCSLQVPPSPPEPEVAMWVPPKNFKNKFLEMKSLNDRIISLNKEIGLTGVRIDYQGIKIFKSGTYQHIFDTKPWSTPVWREAEVFCHISTCFKENDQRLKGHN